MTHKDKQNVDLRTNVTIMIGKLLR